MEGGVNMKPVKGFEDYKVTKDGEVFDKNGRKLTVGRDNQGYATVTLRKDGKSYTRRLHRVVGETYLKPIEGKNIINHKDGDKSHCRLINLEYMSNSENTKHGYDNGFYRSRSKLPVIVIDKDGIESEFTSIRGLSRELGLNRKTVSSILNSGRKNNYDYTFRYKEAGSMYRDYIEKLARSNDAKRKKQYRQMLKRMYGGNDEMISAIKKSGDPNIYHGTKSKHMENIKQNGFKADANVRGQYGKGTYLGDKQTALHYAGNPGDSLKDKEKQITRLKRPSELKGTKKLYGNQSNFKSVTDDVITNQVKGAKAIKPKDKGDIKYLSDRYLEKLTKSKMSNDDIVNHISKKSPKSINGETRDKIMKDLDKIREGRSGRSANKAVGEIFKNRDNARVSRLTNKNLGGKGNIEKIKAYGKLNGKDMLNPSQHNGPHLIATKDVDKDLITSAFNPKGLRSVDEGRKLKVIKRKPIANTGSTAKKIELIPGKSIGKSIKSGDSLVNKAKLLNKKGLGTIGAGLGVGAGLGYLAYKKKQEK